MKDQLFVDCTSGFGPMQAVFTTSDTYSDVHRSTDHVSVARKLCGDWNLPGFWRVKQVAK